MIKLSLNYAKIFSGIGRVGLRRIGVRRGVLRIDGGFPSGDVLPRPGDMGVPFLPNLSPVLGCRVVRSLGLVFDTIGSFGSLVLGDGGVRRQPVAGRVGG